MSSEKSSNLSEYMDQWTEQEDEVQYKDNTGRFLLYITLIILGIILLFVGLYLALSALGVLPTAHELAAKIHYSIFKFFTNLCQNLDMQVCDIP